MPITHSHRQVESDVPGSWFQVPAKNFDDVDVVIIEELQEDSLGRK